MQQVPLDLSTSPKHSLANFLTTGNEAAHQHLRLWLEAEQRPTVPIYLWGASGTGKSHLLKAIANTLQEKQQPYGWLDAKTQLTTSFEPKWRVILLDDVHLYGAILQHNAFNWLINAQAANCGVVACGDAPPTKLVLRDDLSSRLGWGDIFALQTLSDEAQLRVLQTNAQSRGLWLSSEVLDYMNHRFSRDLVNLMSWLDKLDQYALKTKRSITIPMLKEMIIDS